MFIRMEDLIGDVGRHRIDMYIITVVTIHNNHVSVSRGGLVWKTACLVCAYLAGGVNARGVDGVCSYIRW